MSNQEDVASPRLPGTQGRAEPGSRESRAAVRRGRVLVSALFLAALAVSGAEGAAYYFGVLQIWEAFVATPSVPILITVALFVDYEVSEFRSPRRDRRVKSDFRKSLLMLLGGLVSMTGLAVFMASVSSELLRVTLDSAAGSTMICAGIYVVKRFSW